MYSYSEVVSPGDVTGEKDVFPPRDKSQISISRWLRRRNFLSNMKNTLWIPCETTRPWRCGGVQQGGVCEGPPWRAAPGLNHLTATTALFLLLSGVGLGDAPGQRQYALLGFGEMGGCSRFLGHVACCSPPGARRACSTGVVNGGAMHDGREHHLHACSPESPSRGAGQRTNGPPV